MAENRFRKVCPKLSTRKTKDNGHVLSLKPSKFLFCVLLVLATSRSAVHSQGSDQLKSPSARSHGSARHQPLAPLSSAGKNRGSEEHEFLGVDDVLGLSSSSAASYQSSSSEDWTGSNKILITEQNVTDIVSSLGVSTRWHMFMSTSSTMTINSIDI